MDDFIGKIDGVNFESKDGKVRFKSKNGKFKPLRRYNLVDGGTILNNDPAFFLGMEGLVAARNKLYYGKTDPAYLTALAAAQENNKNNKVYCMDSNVLANEIKGDVVYIKGNAKHALKNNGKETLKFYWIFPTDCFSEVEYFY